MRRILIDQRIEKVALKFKEEHKCQPENFKKETVARLNLDWKQLKQLK